MNLYVIVLLSLMAGISSVASVDAIRNALNGNVTWLGAAQNVILTTLLIRMVMP